MKIQKPYLHRRSKRIFQVRLGSQTSILQNKRGQRLKTSTLFCCKTLIINILSNTDAKF